MTREVLLSSRAVEGFNAMSSALRSRIRAGLLRYSTTGRGDVKRLSGVKGGRPMYRLRVGDYRIVFSQDASSPRVTRIIRPGEGYDWL